MTEAPLSYRSYLRLDQILDAQRPCSSTSDRTTWGAERFFIVCHQTSELWVSQVLLDLEDAGRLAAEGNWPDTARSLARAASMIVMLGRNLMQFTHLPVEDFHRFRNELEGASGAESEQFDTLLSGRRMPAVLRIQTHLARALPGVGADAPHPADTCEHAECAAAHGLDDCLDGITAWRVLHASIARHFIGGSRGTGGTTGVDYLLKNIAADGGVLGEKLYRWSQRAGVTVD
jgi:tryptophan 2,3-dioxygenase